MLVWFSSIVLAFASHALFASDVTAWRQSDMAKTGPLQQRIDSLKSGETLRLEAGVHVGPIIIRTPGVTIEGDGSAVITGQKIGTVINIEADKVTVKNLVIEESGDSYDQVDAAISIRNVRDILVQETVIRNSLFGIDVSNSHHVTLKKNRIGSRNFSLGLRGDAIRIWGSKDVHVTSNFWSDTRDAVSWYSERVRFVDNEAVRSRYSIHSMYSKNLFISKNRFKENSVGIFIMYGEGTTVIDNYISHSLGAAGIALGMKETSGLFAKGNQFLYCATGILVDNSPWEPSSLNWFQNNYIAFNVTGVLFSNGRPGNRFEQNVFKGNDIDADSESRVTTESLWNNNYWDNYDGFDRNHDGIGDTPYRVYKYSDLMSGAHPSAKFFFGSPIVSLIGLVERLLPLTDPLMLLEDTKPNLLNSRNNPYAGL